MKVFWKPKVKLYYDQISQDFFLRRHFHFIATYFLFHLWDYFFTKIERNAAVTLQFDDIGVRNLFYFTLFSNICEFVGAKLQIVQCSNFDQLEVCLFLIFWRTCDFFSLLLKNCLENTLKMPASKQVWDFIWVCRAWKSWNLLLKSSPL